MSGKRRQPHQRNELDGVDLESLGPGRHGDGNGLYLRVIPGGSRSWVCRVVVNGKRRDIGLGGLAMTPLEDARFQARKIRMAARHGNLTAIDVPKSESAGLRKLHPIEAGMMRDMYSSGAWTYKKLERVFGVSVGSVDAIIHGDTYRDAPNMPADALKRQAFWKNVADEQERRSHERWIREQVVRAEFAKGRNLIRDLEKLVREAQHGG